MEMESEALLTTILSNSYAKTDCVRRLEIVADVLNGIRFGGEQKTDLADELQAHGASPADAQAIGLWGSEALEALKAEGIIASLKGRIEKLPEFVLYAPIDLLPDSQAHLGTWVRQNVDPKALLILKADRQYAGGCAFVWKDTLYDFSLNYFMQKNGQKLKSLLQTSSYNADAGRTLRVLPASVLGK